MNRTVHNIMDVYCGWRQILVFITHVYFLLWLCGPHLGAVCRKMPKVRSFTAFRKMFVVSLALAACVVSWHDGFVSHVSSVTGRSWWVVDSCQRIANRRWGKINRCRSFPIAHQPQLVASLEANAAGQN